MHNKFVIIDANSSDANDAIVWTGSTNFTDGQVNTDANNIVIFQDQSLAKTYEMEFNEMWSGIFGPYKVDNTPKEFNIGGNRVELYFSPSDNTQAEITRTIATADHDMEFCVYAYTRPEISDSIDERIANGVWGGGVIDDTTGSTNAFSLLEQDMSNTLFLASFTYLVHNKYLLADANAPGLDPLVLTGSHNWTYSANTKNDENTVVVHNASIANQYYQEWVSRYHDEGGTELPSYIVGINDWDQKDISLSIFPNPASERIQFSLNSQSNSSATIQFCDMEGRIMIEESFEKNSSLDVSSLAPGLYLIRIVHDGKTLSGKVMIEK
jgi:phosphatidylserine/phosphatidylglycerophosphate/cardiolipin synthase-like enzyme